MKHRTLSRLILLLLLSCALAATTAYACTGFLVKEELVRSKRGGHTRLCYYDHLGDVFVSTVPSYAFCKVTIDVRHDNEDRDGDGVEDDEEGGDPPERPSGRR